MGKRGSSQIDWIISLSLFLIYITWFFIFIQPSITLGSNKDTLVGLLKDNFVQDFTWSLKKYPLFIESNFSEGRKSIMLDYNSNITDIYFLEDIPFTIWNDKLFLMANISTGTNTFWVIEGTNQSRDYYFEGLNTETDRVATENLSVYFEDSMPVNEFYREEEFIEEMSYQINGISFTPTNSTYDDKGFVAFFSATNGNINHTSVVFSYNPEVENFISLQQNGSYTMQIDIDLYDFDSYYSDNNHYGNFEYSNASQNVNYTFDYVTLTGEEGSLSMFFDNYVDFNYTYFNTTLLLKIEIPLESNYYYSFQFHDSNYTLAKRRYYSSEFGSVEYTEGINLNNISTNYSYLKSKWGFPEDKNFQIILYENSTAFLYLRPKTIHVIGNPEEKGKTIYTEANNIKALEQDGSLETVSIFYRIW